MKITTDFALRALIVFAGGLAAVLLSLKGQGQALPALAVGGTLGVAGTGLLAKSWRDVEGKRIAQKFGNAQWR